MKRLLVVTSLAACSASRPHPGARAVGANPSPPVEAPAAAPDAGARPLVFLGEIRVTSALGSALAGLLARRQPLTVTLVGGASSDASTWKEIAARVQARPAPPGTFTFAYGDYPASHDPVLPAYRRPSFVIDFDEPSVGAARAKAERLGAKPTMEDLAKFVDGYVDKKDMQRAFDVASRVASHKEGDCTEHAVLLAALGRSFGYATRVVLGVALVTLDGRVTAFGHAWVEYAQGSTWRVADAALPRDLAARYVPLEVMRDEGPSFLRGMLGSLAALLLEEIRVEAARP